MILYNRFVFYVLTTANEEIHLYKACCYYYLQVRTQKDFPRHLEWNFC